MFEYFLSFFLFFSAILAMTSPYFPLHSREWRAAATDSRARTLTLNVRGMVERRRVREENLNTAKKMKMKRFSFSFNES